MRCRSQAEMDALVREAGFEKIAPEIEEAGIFSVSVARRVFWPPRVELPVQDYNAAPNFLALAMRKAYLISIPSWRKLVGRPMFLPSGPPRSELVNNFSS